MLTQSTILENDHIKVTRSHYGVGFEMDEHSHSQTAISYILEGQNLEHVDGEQNFLGKSSLVIKPAELPHRNKYDKGCLIVCIYLKSKICLPLRLERNLKQWGAVDSFDFLPVLSLLNMHHKKDDIKDVIKELLKKYLSKTQCQKNPPAWLLEIKRKIESSYDQNLTTSGLAKSCSKHPVYLSRIFKRHFGVAVKEYLHLQRIHAALGKMISTRHGLSQISYDCGFSDQSHMNRRIKASTNFTPRQLQAMMA